MANDARRQLATLHKYIIIALETSGGVEGEGGLLLMRVYAP